MTAVAAKQPLGDDAATDQKGSQVAVGRPRVNFIAWTTGNGQGRTFALDRLDCATRHHRRDAMKGFAIGRQGRTPRHCQRRFSVIPDNRKDPTSS
jgi:hypothetical protein